MKTIILYASKNGCTKNCAKILSSLLDHEVTVADLDDDPNIALSDYTNIIIGAPLYMGKMLKTFKRFCEKNVRILKTKRIAFFACGIAETKEVIKCMDSAIPQELLNIAIAKSHFGAEFKLDNMGMFDKFVAEKIMEKSNEAPTINMKVIEEFAIAIKNYQ